MNSLAGRFVEIYANDIIYKGRLMEMTEDEVYIESEMGCIVIPVDSIGYIKAIDEE